MKEIFHGVYISIVLVFLVYLTIFLDSAIRERQTKATFRTSAILVVFLAFNIVEIVLISNFTFEAAASCLAVLTAILFFAPVGKKKELEIESRFGEGERVDERDTMLARSYLKPGSEEYRKYYAKNPDKKKIDDKIRNMPELLSEGGKLYDSVRSRLVESMFEIEEKRIDEVDGKVADEKIEIRAVEATRTVKEITRLMGADEVGVAALNPNYIYSNAALGTRNWGEKIDLPHKFVIAYTLEMDYDKVTEAPEVGITEESANQYLNAQKISIALAKFIRSIGYSARAHISGSAYQITLPPVAYDAGLGELSRMNYLISPKYGGRIRLGAITTDLPLIPDKPISFGVQDFCEKCNKCAVNCPSKAISEGGKTTIRGVKKWEFSVTQCFSYWRTIGTDCGICMKVCPFSYPNSLPHKIASAGVKRSTFARRLAAWGDKIIYGKRIKY